MYKIIKAVFLLEVKSCSILFLLYSSVYMLCVERPRIRVCFPVMGTNFSIFKASTPALKPTQFPILCALE
jgi:hypothetical protein